MGGLVALDIAARFAGLPAAIVILDLPVVPPQPFHDALRPFAEALRGLGYRQAIRQFLTPFVGFADDPERAERLLDDMAATPQHVIASAMEDYLADTLRRGRRSLQGAPSLRQLGVVTIWRVSRNFARNSSPVRRSGPVTITSSRCPNRSTR